MIRNIVVPESYIHWQNAWKNLSILRYVHCIEKQEKKHDWTGFMIYDIIFYLHCKSEICVNISFANHLSFSYHIYRFHQQSNSDEQSNDRLVAVSIQLCNLTSRKGATAETVEQSYHRSEISHCRMTANLYGKGPSSSHKGSNDNILHLQIPAVYPTARDIRFHLILPDREVTWSLVY